MNKEAKKEYMVNAWQEYKVSSDTKPIEKYVTSLCFAAMSAKKRIDKCGPEAEKKLIAEYSQLLEYSVFHGLKANKLSEEQKRGAANMINLIEEKINRGRTDDNPVLKARSVFNGRVQRGLYTKEQTTSPTVMLDAFMLTCIVDAIEERDVAISDVKGAYLNALMDDFVVMKITGPEVRIFVIWIRV